jgi:transposase-like protein
MKKQRQRHDLDDKRRSVAEYLGGTISADDLAKREGLVRGQIYKWRVPLERRERMSRIETIRRNARCLDRAGEKDTRA